MITTLTCLTRSPVPHERWDVPEGVRYHNAVCEFKTPEDRYVSFRRAVLDIDTDYIINVDSDDPYPRHAWPTADADLIYGSEIEWPRRRHTDGAQHTLGSLRSYPGPHRAIFRTELAHRILRALPETMQVEPAFVLYVLLANLGRVYYDPTFVYNWITATKGDRMRVGRLLHLTRRWLAHEMPGFVEQFRKDNP